MSLPDPFAALAQARHSTPFDVLGLHPGTGGGWVVRVRAPWAADPEVWPEEGPTVAMHPVAEGVFEAEFPEADGPFTYRLRATDPTGRTVWWHDPYRFPPTLDEARVEAILDLTGLR